MFSRAMHEHGGASLDQDPLHLRIASAAVVLGLVATGFVMVMRDAAARSGRQRGELTVRDGTVLSGGAPTGLDYWSLAPAVDLSRHPRAQAVDVRPHDLETYDELARTRKTDDPDK